VFKIMGLKLSKANSGVSQHMFLDVKAQIVNIFSFAGQKVFVGTTGLCHCRTQAVTDNTKQMGEAVS
jgi:hypothetical protein